MNSATIWEVITGAIILGCILLLVNPNSPGPGAIRDIGDALEHLVESATGNPQTTYDTGSSTV